MLTLTLRALAASMAAAVLIGAWFWSHLPASEAADPGHVVRKTASSDTLTEDGRIGNVTDVQGIVAIRPGMAQRWSPVVDRMIVRPGDWVRTDLRGANAVSLQLLKQTGLVLGPGTLVELVSPRQIRIADGELRVAASAKQPLELVGPDGQKTIAAGRQFYRVEKQKLVRVEKEPPWLGGYEGKAANESLGSLVAKVDGRDVPLSVGYHKVTVDIRDQIARTTVEESFVNHTKGTLEGVFYFPLPQDASIAGFGMWIGDRLVEADVVEKQRAREIYETILRERRDPGLLEWSGGNIFKARVFPIFAESEKRITITYTQVLPLRGNAYRYQYALQSELLRQHSLRQLEIDVKISSAVPLRGVSSPTHVTRNALTAHSAHVEFSAQEYAPSQDFEVVAEVDGRQADVVLIPHRRGDDGYFMVQLAPPGATAPQGGWQRQTLGDGQPLELLIVADTSASMDAVSRNLQAQLVAAILGSLTPKDKFNLATCDVDGQWVFARPAAAEAGNIDQARQFLAARASLGWTDLDRAMASALEQCGPKTQVVYIGDGIVTTGNGDPAAFARRLRRLAEGKPGTFHAVATGSSFEPGVLKAIAAIGGGSVRQVGGSRSPQAAALELLGEITQPVLRDAKIEFRGIRAARVYPETLPNLPRGTQQIILGRYLPDARDQTGEVIVSGTLAGKPVRYAARISLKEAESGNSYIPRLWARMHLDALLEQGAATAIRDEIIALSEEYHIITPYTSLLVLESDADRERFAVKPRFQMRDGEKFFAQGRDTANWELVQQQMKHAGTWRQGLRRDVLRQLGTLGRNPKAFQVSREPLFSFFVGFLDGGNRGDGSQTSDDGWDFGGTSGGKGGVTALGALPFLRAGSSESPAFQTTSESVERGEDFQDLFSLQRDQEARVLEPLSGPVDASAPVDPQQSISTQSWDMPFEASGDRLANEEGESDKREWREGLMAQEHTKFPSIDEFRTGMAEAYADIGGRISADTLLDLDVAAAFGESGRSSEGALTHPGGPDGWDYLDAFNTLLPIDGRRGQNWYWRQQSTEWLNALLPALPSPPTAPKQSKKPWPAEARQLARSLLRIDALTGVKDGLRIEIESKSFNARWNELQSRGQTLALVSPAAWLDRSAGDDRQTTVTWCDARQRGALSAAYLLGRVRASKPADLRQPPFGLGLGATTPLDLDYAGYAVQVKSPEKGRKLLVLTVRNDPKREERFLIDTARSVILTRESRYDGKLISTWTQDDFVQLGGVWWAGRIEMTDAEGRRISLVTQKFTALGRGEMDRRWKQELTLRDQVQLLGEPPPKLADARKAISAGHATFDDEMLLVLHFTATQEWPRVFEHLEHAEKLSGKPGMRWVRDALLNLGRRREELRKRFMAEAEQLAQRERITGDAAFLAEYLLGQSWGILEADEMLALVDALRPVYAAQPEYRHAMKAWTQRRIRGLDQARRTLDALKLDKEQAEQWPRDAGLQEAYVRALANMGDYDAALAWLDRVTADEGRWDSGEKESLASARADLLRSAGRYGELADFLARWNERAREATNLYHQYLSALVWAGRIAEADALMARWMKDGRRPEPLPPEVESRLEAAVQLALGQGYNLYTNRIEPRWLAPLGETALYFARQGSAPGVADQIMNNGEFRQTDQCRRVRKEAARMLQSDMDKLSPEQFVRLAGWISANDPAVEPQEWKVIATGLRRRWDAEPKPELKHRFGQSLATILSEHVSKLEWLAFLRTQLADASDEYRPGYALQLFGTLLSQPWSDANETEASSLVQRLTDAEDPLARLEAAVAAIHQMTDRMVQARFAARVKTIEHPEKLSRTQLRDQRAEALRLAREGFADRLRNVAGKAAPELVRWMNLEATYLDVLAGRNLDRAAGECWRLLGDSPRPDASQLDRILDHRCLITLVSLAARKDAGRKLTDRVMKWLEDAARTEPDQPRWKLLQYQLLVALDRPKELEKRLRQWIDAGDPGSPWRLTLGYLLAEQGKLAEAIGLLESVRARAELRGADLRVLAEWYSATDQREAHDRAVVDAFKAVEENRSSNWLYQKLRPWQPTGPGSPPPPRELDSQVPLAFMALLEKSEAPQNYLPQLQNAYQTTRDFRLLAALADSMVGHTAGQVYPFLQGMGGVLSQIGDEATVDSIVQQIAKVRGRAKTPIDQRALDLLEVLVQRRAAELKNQPGPHAARALAALQRAWKRQWSAGEPRLVADLLFSLGQISDRQLAGEQVRELESLHRDAPQGSSDRLQIAHDLARVFWSYSRQDAAIDLLTASLAEYQAACGGVLPSCGSGTGGSYGYGTPNSYGYGTGNSYGLGTGSSYGSGTSTANEPLSTLVSFLEQQSHFARGESVLQEQLKHPANRQQVYWLTQQLYGLYQQAIFHDGEVSLGQGAALYHAVERKIQKDLDTHDQNHRAALINLLCGLYRTARDKGIAGVVEDLKRLAFQRMPEVLKRQVNQYDAVVSQVAHTLYDLAGPRDGFAFFIRQIETEPAWRQYNNQDGWSSFGNTLAEWRSQVKELKNLGDLEPRLLKIVVKELRRDLQSQNARSSYIYNRQYPWYWREKEEIFVKTAQEVLAENRNSGAIVLYIANYLYSGVNRPRLAIDALLDAHRREVLDEAGQSRLVEFLHGQDRFGESIGILEPLVERRPDNLRYRVSLMWGYFKTSRPQQLAELLAKTDAHFHKENRWNEDAMAPWAIAASIAGFISSRSLTCRKQFRIASARRPIGVSATARSRTTTCGLPRPTQG